MAEVNQATLRLFVSSPGDVLIERDRVDRVVKRLNAALQGVVSIETIRWEHQYYTADATFQAQIVDAGKCDIVISIFWQRLGTPLPPDFERMSNGQPYPSGTVFEVMKAIEARASSDNGLPDILVYRKLADAAAPIIDRERYKIAHEQRLAFLDFWEQWFFTAEGQFKAAYNTFETTDEFESQLESHLNKWLVDRGYVLRNVAWSIAIKGSPFRGLEAFGPADEDILFGRQQEIAKALERLGRTTLRQCSFLLLVGESGSGKSSLARAGIVPKVLRGSLPGQVESWRYLELRPAGDVCSAFAHGLFSEHALPELRLGDFNSPDAFSELLKTSGKPAAASILRALDRAGQEAQRKLASDVPVEAGLVLMLDQFEGFLDDDGIKCFALCLNDLARSGRVTIIATLRSDAYANLARIPELLTLKDAGEVLDVTTPGPAGIAEIVREPARLAGLVFGKNPGSDEKVDERIIGAATGGDVLPLIEFTLSRLYAQMLERLARQGISAAQAKPEDLILAYEDYLAFGGLEGSIAEAAERAFIAIEPAAQAELPRLLRTLLRMVDTSALKHSRESLEPVAFRMIDAPFHAAASDANSKILVQALIDARILILGRDENNVEWVRLAHEAILRSWPRASDAIASNASFFRIRADVMAAEHRWRRHGADSNGESANAFLISAGVPLAEAENIKQNFASELSPSLLDFIERSSRHAKKKFRQLVMASVVFSVTAIIAALAAGAAWIARGQAVANATLAHSNADKALGNFHRAADQAEQLIISLGDQLKFDPTVTRDTLKIILAEGRRQIEALAIQDPDDRYIQQVRAKAIAIIAGNYLDLGETKAAKSMIDECMHEMSKRSRDNWEYMDRHAAAVCLNIASRIASSEGDNDLALGKIQEAIELNARNARDRYDPVAIRNLVLAAIAAGDIWVKIGNLEKAERHYAQALSLQRNVVEQGKTPQAVEDLDFALDRAGKIADLQGKNAEAQKAYLEILANLKGAEDLSKPNSLQIENTSIAYAKVGLLLMREGKHAESLEYFRQSLEIRNRLVSLDGANRRWKTLRAEALQAYGVQQSRVGNTREGLPLIEAAIHEYRAIAKQDASNRSSRHNLGIALNAFAAAALATDRPAALQAAKGSLEIFREFTAVESASPAAFLDLAATFLLFADAGEDVRKNYQEAIDIYAALDRRGALPPRMKDFMNRLQESLKKLPVP